VTSFYSAAGEKRIWEEQNENLDAPAGLHLQDMPFLYHSKAFSRFPIFQGYKIIRKILSSLPRL